MRFLLVVAIWMVIVGGLWTYVAQRDQKREMIKPPVAADISVDGQFSIEVTPTFSIEDDPFALTTSPTDSASLEVRLNGMTIDVGQSEILRGQVIRMDGVDGVLAGHNEIYVSASPPVSESGMEHGIRVKFFDASSLLVDETVWAEQGGRVSGSVSYHHSQPEEDSHDQ